MSKYQLDVLLSLQLYQCIMGENMEERDKKMAVAILLIAVGGAIGAGIALLFAQQTGRETRKDIVRYAKKTRRKTDEAVV